MNNRADTAITPIRLRRIAEEEGIEWEAFRVERLMDMFIVQIVLPRRFMWFRFLHRRRCKRVQERLIQVYDEFFGEEADDTPILVTVY